MAATASTPFRLNVAPIAKPAEERVPSKLWLNIGQVLNIGGESVFVPLPQGVAADTMPKADERGKSEWATQQRLRNMLLEQLNAYLADLAPGETRDLPLVVQARRINEGEVAAGVEDVKFNF